MKIRMKVHITGARNGVRWPGPGATVELPDAEAAKLVAAGLADPVADLKADEEKAVPPKAEERSESPRPRQTRKPKTTDR